ncbi:MAG: WYL domain-containing protein [Anaerolineae bacterium]|nr:WYL domain-containing protein [Anaerolineae bacterium]
MSKQKALHDRRSQWRVVLRCLSLLQRLMQGPATTSELKKIVQREAEENAEDVLDSAILKRLEEDRRRLRETFECEFDYDRRNELYTLVSVGRALIDLPPEALRGLAFLQVTFHETAPMAQEIKSLVEILGRAMPSTRQKQLSNERGMVELDLRAGDDDDINELVWDKVAEAIKHARQLKFKYLSPGREDGLPVNHRVEPQRTYFDDNHFYLQAYCIETESSNGRYSQQKIWHYRIGRISEPTLLETRFVRDSHSPREYDLIYQLDAAIARRGATRRFAKTTLEVQLDKSAIVRAVSYDLFSDLRTLLKYGAGCRVLGGEEALKEMKTLITQMYQRYQDNADNA